MSSSSLEGPGAISGAKFRSDPMVAPGERAPVGISTDSEETLRASHVNYEIVSNFYQERKNTYGLLTATTFFSQLSVQEFSLI